MQATADQKAIDSSYRRLCEKYDLKHNKDAVGADALRHVLADTLEDIILDGNAVDRARDANEAIFYHILKDAVAARPDVRAYVDKTARSLAESSRRLSVAYGVLTGIAQRAAVGRLAFYDFFFKELSSSASSNWDQAAEYLERVG